MMDKKYRFTVIIPHRNCPDLLARCIESVGLESDVQLIIVDDNSSGDIVDFDAFPGRNDPRIDVIFDKSGKGAGHARNIGLAHAEGEWVIFADADDFFTEGMYATIDRHSGTGADIVCFKPVDLNEDLSVHEGPAKIPYYLSHFEDKPEAREYMFRYMASEPWCKMYRTEFIKKHSIAFDETSVANDWGFSARAGYHAEKIEWHDVPFYCYIHRASSLCNSRPGEKQMLDRAWVYASLCSFMHEKGVTWSDDALYRHLYSMITSPGLFMKALRRTSFYKSIPALAWSTVWWRLSRRRKMGLGYYFNCPLCR